MPVGPGKYDDTCTEVRLRHGASFVLLAIIGGDRGQGFSVQMEFVAGDPDRDAAVVNLNVVKMLRTIADQIEEAMVKN
jgi:hypothetical protein